MSKKHQALKDWEKTKQREKYWEKIFEKMSSNKSINSGREDILFKN